MGYTLKSTGLAAQARYILMLDEDGVTLREWVNGWNSVWDSISAWTDNNAASMTVDDPVVAGADTWKGTTFDYFETKPNGNNNFYGMDFPAGLDSQGGNGENGFGVFIATAGIASGSGGFQRYGIISSGDEWFGPDPDDSENLVYGFGSNGILLNSGQIIPTDGTKFSIGGNFTFAGSEEHFYGLESGSLSSVGSDTDPGNTFADFESIGGTRGGFGHTPSKCFIVAIFDPLTLSEYQSLHNDWFGELFESADATAPTLTNPTGTDTGNTTADGSVDTDEDNGTLYWIVDQSATAPSVAQIQAGQDDTGSEADDSGNQSVSSTGTQNVSATGLTGGTTYYFHYQHQDAAGNDSSVVSSTSFTTSNLGNGGKLAGGFGFNLVG